MINSILAMLLVHWIADFVLQSDQMALNKSKSIMWLSIHVLVYSTVLFVGLLIFHQDLTIEMLSIIALFNGGSHIIIDATTSRLNSYLWKKEKRHWFFVTIGFDQFIHTGILIISLVGVNP